MAPSSQLLETILGVAEWIRLLLELLGIISIVIGAVVAVVAIARPMVERRRISLTAARFQLARYLALALEFQLAADILGTTISPTWTKLGELAAIGAIRTALNYFLGREMDEERQALVMAAAPESMPEPAEGSPPQSAA